MTESREFGICPLPLAVDGERVTLAHGEGARLTRQLIEGTILPRLAPVVCDADQLSDAAHLSLPDGSLAFTTDSFVVSPLFFPGGNIGELAVYGTVNDLAVSGAEPLWLSLSLILEEGLPMMILEQVLESVAAAAVQAGVRIATGDTKVVPHRAADGIFITTSGIGRVLSPRVPGAASLRNGDRLLVTGPIGSHGLAILAAREQLDFHPPLRSDCGCLWPLVRQLQQHGLLSHVRAMRDATRGGVAAVLHEWASASRLTLCIDESHLPVLPAVRGASELLGIDPIYVANEGVMVLAVEAAHAETIMSALRTVTIGEQTTVIGQVEERRGAPVIAIRATGSPRPVDEASGLLLPRIC